MKTEYKVIVLSILLGLFLWVADAALDYFIYYQGTFWGLLIYEIPPHEIYARTLVLGCCVIFGAAISTVFGKFRRAEEKRRESEKQLRLAVKNSRDVLYKLNLRTGDFDYVSPSVVELGGYTPQEFILLGVKGLLRRIDPEDRHRFMMHFRNVLRLAVEDGLAPTIEYRWKHHDGEYRWFSDNRTVICDGDGNPVSLIGSVRDVTEQKEAEWALWESEKKYRTMIETAQEGVAITSPGEELIFVNKAFASILGYEPSELVGKKCYEVVHGRERPPADCPHKQLLESKKAVTSEFFDPQLGAYLQASASPIFDEDGEVAGCVHIVKDITERKKAEEALRQSEKQASTAIEAAKALTFDYNIATGKIDWGGAIKEITGYTPEEFAKIDVDGWAERIHPDDRDKILSILQEAMGKDRATAEYRFKTKKGYITLSSVSLTEKQDGKAVRLVGTLQDITERKRAEEAIRHSEEQLRALFDSAADLVFTKDREGRYMRVNSACARLHGISEEEFLGKTDFDLFPEEQAKHSAEIDRQVLVEGRTFTGEYDRQVRGKTLTFSVVKTPLYGHDGAMIGLCGIVRDVTEQKSLEEQFRQAQKMESLGTLAGGVAHDFNNLLGGILGYVGLMKGDYSPEEKHYAMLELVEKASVRAAELTNQLLAFSRKGKYELRAVDLNNSVEDVLKLMGRTLDKNIEIATELQEKLPSVEGDPVQLEQAILNLCVNAAEAMPGGGKLQLETRVVALGEEFADKYLGSDSGDYVLLSVSDTGIGMDSETLSRMFEPFFTTKEVGKGTGLGLSTVYGIVKNHGGYVDVRSQPGKGSTFDIYLPVSKKQFTPLRPRAAELQTGHETILAVDDEEIIRSLLEETLQKLGYKVILANDGEEAVQIYEERKDEIDAVIIDMIMPHLGGGETFREIRRRNPDVRVLLASGYSQDGAAQRILDEGVRGFIQKPFELVELSRKLRQVLD